MHEQTDLHRVLGALNQQRALLNVDTAQLCYLVVLRVHSARNNLVSLSDVNLIELYLQVCGLIEPEALNPRKRATHAIEQLRAQRLLRRVDGGSFGREGEYTLTQLAAGIVDFFVADETLTRESLVVLMRALISQLSAILVDARNAKTDEAWQADVTEPLRVTVQDLLAGIERRQRGMDVQQRETRERISILLQQDWFAAVGDCETLLEVTSTTLNELSEILLHDGARLQEQLQDIEQVAMDAGADTAVEQAQRVQEYIDRATAWGGVRQRAWSDYYQYVQTFLRDTVRLDPERAVSRRLRAQLAGWLEQPFSLVVADEPSIRLLRETESRVKRPPVTRRAANREHEVALVAQDLMPAILEQRVDEALALGYRSLVEVTEFALREMPAARRYRFAGRVAALVASRVEVRSTYERPWQRAGGQFEIEEWTWTVDSGAHDES